MSVDSLISRNVFNALLQNENCLLIQMRKFYSDLVKFDESIRLTQAMPKRYFNFCYSFARVLRAAYADTSLMLVLSSCKVFGPSQSCNRTQITLAATPNPNPQIKKDFIQV